MLLQPRSSLSRGFTLMELTVVLVIVGLLLGGLLMPLTTQRDMESIRNNAKTLAEIREALIGFALVNGRLPCPAQTSIASTAANAGLEAVYPSSGVSMACTCAAAISPGVAQYYAASPVYCPATTTSDTVGGVLPWATLGLPEPDAWGNRYTYHVTTFFARGVDSAQTLFGGSCTPTTTPTNAAFALCTPGGIDIYTAVSHTVTLATLVPALVVSHGKTAAGAYTATGTQITPATPGTDEADNSNGDTSFVSNATIDDQLIWIPTSVLMGRLLSAGKLP